MCEIPQLSYPHVNLIKLSLSSSWTAAKHLICSISFYSFKCILLPSGIIKTNSSRSYCVKRGQWNNATSPCSPPLLPLAVWYPFQNSCCHPLIPQGSLWEDWQDRCWSPHPAEHSLSQPCSALQSQTAGTNKSCLGAESR